MTPEDVSDKLSRLTGRQREVLALRCEGLDYKTIAERLGIKIRTVKAHMGNIYTVLEFRDEEDRLDPRLKAERMKLLFEVYCPALKAGGLPPPPPEPEEPEPVPEDVERLVEEDESLLVLWKGGPIVPVSQPNLPLAPPPPPRRRLRGVLVGMVIGVVLMGFLFLLMRGIGEGEESQSEVPKAPPAQMSEVTVVHTQEVTHEVTRIITATPAPTQPTQTPFIQTQEVLVPATSTPLSNTPISDPSRTDGTATSEPTESAPGFGLPTGEWAVRIYETDDANIILVNGHIAVASELRQETEWVIINDLLRADAPNYVTFVNLNTQERGYWGVALRHNETTIWGNEGETRKGNSLSYAQTVQINSDNTVEEVNLRDFGKAPIVGEWSARVEAEDIGVIIVNGVPVAGGLRKDTMGWMDFSGLLYANEENIISALVWNFGDSYSWDMALRRGETIVWGSDGSGSGQVGEVFLTQFVIDGEGNVVR